MKRNSGVRFLAVAAAIAAAGHLADARAVGLLGKLAGKGKPGPQAQIQVNPSTNGKVGKTMDLLSAETPCRITLDRDKSVNRVSMEIEGKYTLSADFKHLGDRSSSRYEWGLAPMDRVLALAIDPDTGKVYSIP